MVELSALHSLTIEMHGGMLTLAAISILAIVLARIHQRLRRTSGWYAGFKVFDSTAERLLQYAEPTAYVAAIGGVIGLIVSSFIGFYAWPYDALMNSPLGLTKVLFSIFSTELWAIFVAVRSWYGEKLWQNRPLSAVFASIGIAGFFFMVLTGSFGGHMATKGSVLDPIYQLLGTDPEAFWIIGLDVLPILIGVAFVEIVVFFSLFLRIRKAAARRQTDLVKL